MFARDTRGSAKKTDNISGNVLIAFRRGNDLKKIELCSFPFTIQYTQFDCPSPSYPFHQIIL